MFDPAAASRFFNLPQHDFHPLVQIIKDILSMIFIFLYSLSPIKMGSSVQVLIAITDHITITIIVLVQIIKYILSMIFMFLFSLSRIKMSFQGPHQYNLQL